MNLYLPLWLYRIRYETAWGRPYSEIDRLVLGALADRAAKLDEICAVFALRKPLIVEVLVTLARAGWLTLNASSGCFYTTPAGKRALGTSELPAFVHIEPRTETIVVERLRGGIASRDEVQFQTTRALEQQPDFTAQSRLTGEFFSRRIDAGQVDGLLPCEPPRWLRWVDVPACVSEVHWVCVSVDLDCGEVSGLPERWRRSIGPQMLDLVAKRQGRPVPVVRPPEDSSPVSSVTSPHSIEFTPDDLLATPEAHAGLLIQTLHKASTAVYVASAFFNPTILGAATREAVLAALRRGVRVGFLWGYEEGEAAREAVQWMETIRKEAGDAGRNFHFNRDASGSHAKFLFRDDTTGQPCLYLGSYNWLSSPPTASPESPVNLTVRLRDPALLAEILRTFAGLWLNVPQQTWLPAAEHLQQIASTLAGRAAALPPRLPLASDCQVRVIRDQEHEAIMFELLNSVRERCWVASHKLGSKASIRLASLLNSATPPPTHTLINYELPFVEETRLQGLKAELAARGARFEQRPHFHAKCVVTDDRAMISSFNFLSADPFNNSSNAREVGLLIEGGFLPKELWNRFAASGV